MRLIDTHTHLNTEPFADDRAAAFARASAAGVAHLIEVGYDLASSRAAIALAERHPHVSAVVGIQPNHALDLPDDWLDQVGELARHPRAVAIGEIGLDYHWDTVPATVQDQVFRAQLALAREMRLPVVIHSRDADTAMISVLGDLARGQSGVMHSFSGDWAYAQACLDIGFMLSFSGPLTFKKATDLHEVATRAPANRILTETDSPWLAPHPKRGTRNEPANVRLVAEQLARLRGLTLDSLAALVWENAQVLFGPLHADELAL